jgi:hypothetical protein
MVVCLCCESALSVACQKTRFTLVKKVPSRTGFLVICCIKQGFLYHVFYIVYNIRDIEQSSLWAKNGSL